MTKVAHALLLAVGIIILWRFFLSPSVLFNNISDGASSTPHIPSSSNKSPYAYVTLLAPHPKLDEKPDLPDDEDEYFVATRVLGYQLMHQPDTATNSSIPFVVLVTPNVTKSKVERLRKDGAIVNVVERLSIQWEEAGLDRWRDVLTKLRMLEMTQYEKLLCLDADMLIANRLDSAFKDPTTKPRPVNMSLAVEDEGPLPKQYMYAAQTYFEGRDHEWPFPPGNYSAVGFFMIQPSISIFNYYMKIASMPKRFNANAPEQGLLNYAHRKDGPMPWTEINYKYTTQWPAMKQYEQGCHALHEKFWDMAANVDMPLRMKWFEAKGRMEGFYAQKDGNDLR